MNLPLSRAVATAEPAKDDLVAWLIIVAFYAPLHLLLPVLFLLITGSEPKHVRKGLIRRALIDSTLSMAGAFAIVISIAGEGLLSEAMLVLLVSIGFPFIRIWRHRHEITEQTDGQKVRRQVLDLDPDRVRRRMLRKPTPTKARMPGAGT